MASVARALVSALALAGGATALLEQYVTVTHVEEVVFPGKINVAAVRPVVAAAAVTDAEISACASADVVLSACVASGYLDDGAPTASAKSCLCCYKGLTLIDEYSSCSTYISKSFPTETAAFATISLLYGICETGTCAAGATPASTRATTTPTVTPPAGCTSFVSVYESCTSKVPGGAVTKMADCLCYDLVGKYNTKFDDYANSCAPFAKTAVPTEYSIISALGSFCKEFPPSSTHSTSKGGGFGAIGTKPSTTSAPSASSFDTVVTVTAPAAPGGAAGGAAVPAVVVWIASFASFVLSFFVLV